VIFILDLSQITSEEHIATIASFSGLCVSLAKFEKQVLSQATKFDLCTSIPCSLQLHMTTHHNCAVTMVYGSSSSGVGIHKHIIFYLQTGRWMWYCGRT